MRTRTATPHDAAAIARIYNEGITDRVATFATELRIVGDFEDWFTGDRVILKGAWRDVVIVERLLPRNPT